VELKLHLAVGEAVVPSLEVVAEAENPAAIGQENMSATRRANISSSDNLMNLGQDGPGTPPLSV
jgi:hypothetical protein